MPTRPDLCEVCSKPAFATRTLFSWRFTQSASLCPGCIAVADGDNAEARADLWQRVQIRRDQEAHGQQERAE